MNLKKKILGLNSLLVITLLLSACGAPATPVAPTIDTNMLFTQAAQTVVADLTKNAPTITPTTAATNTPQPTATQLGGLLPTLPMISGIGGIPTLAAFPTATSQAYNGPDKAMYITQSPSDYATVKAGQVFNVTWRLQNTGTTTWTTKYAYRFYSATNKLPTSANGYNLTASVPPNGVVDLTAVATAPSSAGTYDALWVLTNPDMTNFASFSITVNVVGTSSGSSSASVATSTGVPNDCEVQTVDGSPWYIAAGANKDFNVPGGQVGVVFMANSTTTKSTVHITDTLSSYSNDVAAPLSEVAEYFGNPSKSPNTVTVTNTGTVEVKVTKVYYYSANVSCP